MPAKLPAALPTDRKKCSQILLAMKLSQYGYDFSADLLAKYPAEKVSTRVIIRAFLTVISECRALKCKVVV